MRHLATIEKIADVQSIENADAIERVKVREWWCVTKKGEFKIGDICVYFEIDSLLPSSNPIFSFLAKGTRERTQVVNGKEYKGYRLKTIKLRGQLSQGLALPISVVLPGTWAENEWGVGDDITDLMEVVKYEVPIPANLAGQVKGNFPGFLFKTDEERIQNCAEILIKHSGELFYVAEKIDGSSCTYYKKDNEFGVCSRNLELKDTEGNTFWQLAKDLKLIENLPDGYAVQGEVAGPGIQGNPLKLPAHMFFLFNVYNIVEGKFLDYKDVVAFAHQYELQTVPIIDEYFKLKPTVQEMLDYAIGKSLLNSDVEREGVVVRPLHEMEEEISGAISRLSFKVISNKYLLDYEQ